MSVIAKCPVCGETLSGHIDGVVECKDGCSFRCGGYALPRIAAAMELAKAAVWAYECEDQKDYMDDTTSNRDAWRSIVNLDLEANDKALEAQDRVIEVFEK